MYLRPFVATTALVLIGSAVSAQTLIHRYTFNGDASDSVGSANGTLNSGAVASGGKLTLDGVSANVSFTQHIIPTSGAYSVAFFARQSALQGHTIEWLSQGFSGGPGSYVGYDPSGQIRATDSWLSTGQSFTANGSYQHIALVTNGAASSLYLNGTLAASLASGLNTTAGGDNTRFGQQFGGFGELFAGDLKDVRIYTGALSAPQVAALASTPEPGTTAFLIALGMAGTGFAMRRKRKSRTSVHSV